MSHLYRDSAWLRALECCDAFGSPLDFLAVAGSLPWTVGVTAKELPGSGPPSAIVKFVQPSRATNPAHRMAAVAARSVSVKIA